MARKQTSHTENCLFVIMWGGDHYSTSYNVGSGESSYDKLTNVSNNSSVSALFAQTTGYYAHRLPVFPENISDGYSANWAQQEVIGRTSPLFSYTSTGFRTVSFDLTFHRELVFDNEKYQSFKGLSKSKRNSSYTPIEEIEEILNALKLACYPIYASNGLVSPVIFFRFGQFTCKGYMESVSYSWEPPIIDDKFMVCKVSIGPINCSPKSVLSGSANILMKDGYSMNPFGNSNDSSGSTAWTPQGGR